MDGTVKHTNVSPETSSNVFSKLFFCWAFPLLKTGLQKDLEVKDLYNTTKPDLSETLGDALEKHWNKEYKKALESKRRPSLSKALVKTFWKSYSAYGFILFIQCVVLRLIHPLVLAELIKFFQNEKGNYQQSDGLLIASGVVVITILNVLIMHHAVQGCTRIGMRWRIACCSLMYRKLLKLSKTTLNKTDAGHVINLMSNDVQRFEMLALFAHYLWITPIQAMIAACIMYDGVGFPAIIGVLSIAIQAIPLQGYLSKLQGKYRGKIAEATDYRVKLMSEITSGIQIIKMYAWEKPFEKLVRLSRKLEIDIITKKSYILGFMTALMVFTERTSLYIMVVTYVLSGNRLTSNLVFSMAQFFNIIQLYMAIFFPLAVASYAEAKVSIRRIEDFLILPENQRYLSLEQGEVKGAINIVKAKASWIPNPIIDTLSNINVKINQGMLCAVVGTVGAGKSSLLQLILKELPVSSGKLEIRGVVSYASQEPWLFVSSVRNNILFGQSYERTRYREVVRVCALKTDFEQFTHGDKTLVGERGVSLSGGQRARINLARAVYRNADIYLFDDPLSAVDPHVSKHLFGECIKGYLKEKTRILVTHQLQFLREVDLILIMNNGQIEKMGTYSELAKDLLDLQQHSGHIEENPAEGNKETVPEETTPRKRLMSVVSETSTNIDGEEIAEPTETQELMEKGSIPTTTYWQYFHAGTSLLVLIILVVLILIAQAVCNSGDLWLKYWTNQEEISCNEIKNVFANFTTTPSYNSSDGSTELKTLFEIDECKQDERSRNNYIIVYSVLIALTMILTTIRSLVFYKICMNSSRSLHNTMFNNILQATMRFFNTNPSGRILNRFSKDIGAVDEFLPRVFLDSIQIFMVMTGILVMVFIVSPWMIIPAAVLGGMFAGARYIYMSSAQDLKRLEGITRAPVFSHVSASLSGLTTIRSSLAERMIAKEFDVLQDQHTASFYLMIYTAETFGFYLDVISIIFLSIVTFQFFLIDNVLGGDVGLVISQSLILTGMLQFGMRQTTEVASNMTSVERVLQYTKLEKEGPFESSPTKKPHRDWPDKGAIEFKNVYLQYSPTDPPVLTNLNFKINAGEKIGIVGRTGAGKSSLISAIFRLAPIEGAILIDGIDTKEIGLIDLRSNISIIPQEPVLFSTTIRNNLDPFDKCDDATLWKSLENVELKDSIDKLEQEVSEGGSNFSAGQRQLVCLARAIIRKNRIIILDEATANVDQQTDSLIQKTIRNNFQNCTVLTIAHRLNTIMDSDKVLVMEAGEVMEFDHPHELLQKPGGYFRGMLRQTGDQTYSMLSEVARRAFEGRAAKSAPTVIPEEDVLED